MSEKLSLSNKFKLATGLAFGGIAVASCANYEGTGNEFAVTVVVEDSTHQSITGKLLRVEQADGVAEMWFDDIGGTDEFHDNCDCDGFLHSRKKYGELYELGGDIAISPETLEVGQCVGLIGKIRDDYDGDDMHHERPVYDRAEEVICG